MNALSFTHEERVRRFVDSHILLCQSILVEHLLTRGDVSGFSWDEVTNLYDDGMDAVEEFLANAPGLKPEDWHELPFDGREELAREHGFEPELHEIYEWWVVTPYVAERLREFGEPVLENDFGVWWGRTCTGQSVCLDGVIARLLGDGCGDA
jgi:hypothetical protein